MPPCGVSDELKEDVVIDGVLVGAAARMDAEGQGGQLRKARWWMAVTPSGMTKEVWELQPEKAKRLISVTPSGMTTSLRGRCIR